MGYTSAKHEFRDVAQELTNRIIEVIAATGKLPWKREWDSSKCAGPQAPGNAFTGEPYHGVNSLMFGLDTGAIISGDPRWATFKQPQISIVTPRKAQSLFWAFSTSRLRWMTKRPRTASGPCRF